MAVFAHDIRCGADDHDRLQACHWAVTRIADTDRSMLRWLGNRPDPDTSRRVERSNRRGRARYGSVATTSQSGARCRNHPGRGVNYFALEKSQQTQRTYACSSGR